MSTGSSPRADTTQTQVSDRLAPFGTTIFAEMTALAIEHDAVNLSQGFPDFDGPDFIKHAAVEAIGSGQNQYARSQGIARLNEAIATRWHAATGVRIDPTAQVTVTSGCTEALAATFLGLVNPGDEVVLFEPYYDSYRACVAMAGAIPRFVTLHAPGADSAPDAAFQFDPDELRRAFTARTRAILVNTPHNPTGKVFSREELALVADLCIAHDVIAITDEVYEDLVYEPDRPHLRLATFDGMSDRTVTLSSLGKTFSLTGWKIGWAIASPALSAGVRAAHQFLTYATATPLQHGAAQALTGGEDYIESLLGHYRAARDYLCQALSEIGLGVFKPAGTYFIMADHSPVSARLGLGDDVAFCRYLTGTVGVAAIPPSVFYEHREHGSRLVRFAFCKKMDTLEEAVRRMRSIA